VGETLTVEDAIQAIITRSANDIAVAVAEKLGGNEPAFAQRMTSKARAIGMSRTTFRNASGLPVSGQVTTARDMSTLAHRIMLDFPQYYHYFAADEVIVAGRTVKGHNRLLDSYPGMDGMKTGFINASGFNLVSSASRGGIRLIGVVFGGKTARSRDLHMVELINDGFKKYGVLAAKPGPRGLISFRQKFVRKPVEMRVQKPVQKAVNSNPPPVINEVFQSPQVMTAPVVTTSPMPQNWAIQIGAYRDEVSALAAATETLRALRISGQPKVAPAETPAGLLYRAQITDLSQDQSGAACAALAALTRNCLVLAPGQGD
jgi:D-alanyl-D-alanine carboxypeptidase